MARRARARAIADDDDARRRDDDDGDDDGDDDARGVATRDADAMR